MMRHSSWFPYAVATVAALVAPAQAAQDPSAAFFSAYMSYQQAEKLERENSFKAALAKYRYTAGLLDQISSRHPDWQKAIVDYRQRKTSEAIANLEQKLALEAPPAAVEEPALPTHEAQDNVARPSNTPAADVMEEAAREIRTQMAALRQQLQVSQAALQDVRQEKETLSGQLTEAVRQLHEKAPTAGDATAKELEAARASEARLREELAAARAGGGTAPAPEGATPASREAELMGELQKAWESAAQAKKQLAEANTNESELQTRLQEALGQLQQARTGEAAAQQQQEEISKLRDALEDARADREVAEEQGRLLARKMATLAQRPDLTAKLAETEAKAKQVSEENERLIAAAAEADKKLAELTTRLEASTTENTRLSGELGESQKRVTALEEAEKSLIAQLKEKETANTELTTELASTRKERDEALGQLATAKESEAKLEKLLAENGELTRKLDEAEKSIAAFNEATPEKEKELASLKEELAGVQTQLAAAQEESRETHDAMSELHLQLQESELATSGASEPEERRKMTEENELLRGIVLRQLKDQARREQARKLIVEELGRLQVRSETLNDQVAFLGEPVVKLTDEERALFKTPQMEIVDNEAETLAISITAPQGEGGETAPMENTEPRPPGRNDLPAELQPLLADAKEKFEEGKYDEAETAYEQLLAKAPNNVYTLSNLGVTRFRAGKLMLAEETFRKILSIAPNDAFSHATLGIVYFQQSRYDDAIKSLTRSLAVNPKNATAHNYLGVTAAQKGWTEAAQKEIETAIQIDPLYSDAHFNLAVVLATAQRPDRNKARYHYTKALELGSAKDSALEELLK